MFGSRMNEEDYVLNMAGAGTSLRAASAMSSTAEEQDLPWANDVASEPRGMHRTIWALLFSLGRKLVTAKALPSPRHQWLTVLTPDEAEDIEWNVVAPAGAGKFCRGGSNVQPTQGQQKLPPEGMAGQEQQRQNQHLPSKPQLNALVANALKYIATKQLDDAQLEANLARQGTTIPFKQGKVWDWVSQQSEVMILCAMGNRLFVKMIHSVI